MFFNRHIRKYYFKYAPKYIIGILANILVDFVQLEIPKVVSSFINLESYDVTMDVAMYTISKIVLFTLIMLVMRTLWRVCIIGNSINIEKDLRDEMYEHQQGLSQSYFSKQKIGGMMSLYLNDLQTVRFSLGFGIIMIIDTVFLTAFTLVNMFIASWELALFTAIPIFFVGIFGMFVGKKIDASYDKQLQERDKLSDFVQENFTGISVVRAFVREENEKLTLEEKNKAVYDAAYDFHKKVSWIETVIETVIYLSILIILGVGTFLVFNMNLSTGAVVEMYMYFGYLIWPMIAMAQLISNLSQGSASIRRIAELLDLNSEISDSSDAIDTDLSGDIAFNNLTFTYPEAETPVLENVSFTITKGELVGIIGKTGSGKSTIVELLLRSYNVENNTILFDGVDLMKIKLDSLRKNIGYVPQNNFLYSETIENNIAFGIDDFSKEYIEQIATYSDVHENIMAFKNHYQTIIGERGTTLSGGQKQRISIARAIAKNPNVLILDDSVSAVDTETEAKIIKNMRSIRNNKTTIFIGHRISTMAQLDKVIVLDKGKIVAIGKHDDLVKQSSFYQALVKEQELQKVNG